ncbi:MAG: hypothetical protein ACFFB3_13775 [Candidatus Hodarchaeota archaeon]
MCGVLGLFGTRLDLHVFRFWLGFLTHRGQDASGMAWFEEPDNFCLSKAHAYPEEISLPSYSSRIILGSTRYPTHGRRVVSEEGISRFAQPFIKQSQYGTLAIVHNGQITNVSNLSLNNDYFSDAEAICDLLSQFIVESKGNLQNAVGMLMEILDGAYSIIAALCSREKQQFFTFRDPWGIRPLVWGYRNGQVAVASESVVLDHIAIDEVRNVNPGELLYFHI